jgi:putative tryptophan/tyrosine transport system substrate-binding protein
MKRREFITLLGGAAAGWPLAARGQQPAMPVVGFLRSTGAAGSAHLVAAFRQGLNEAGFVEGQNVAIDYRWADDQYERLHGLAADLIRRHVAVIVGNIITVRLIMAAITTTPIVFVGGSDPVRSGVVASLNRPGGNITGVIFDADLTAKRLGLLAELVPKTTAIAVLLDPNSVESDIQAQHAEEAGRAMGKEILIVKTANEGEFTAAFATIIKAGVGALLVGGGPVFLSQRRHLVALAARHALPASYVTRAYPEAGGLMSYGPSQTDAYRRGGIYVGRVLKGERPAEMPVELAVKFDLIINVATAKAFGLEIPATILALADEVIE